ncbi:MAG: hypothetical protein HC808_16025 [Candidatus Competibacteraceae bacterium]|nr:hypothetical protein [Candidatus Competibacteraceae bacterium]
MDYTRKKQAADPGNAPDEWVTDTLVAQAHARREGEEYPTPEWLLKNLPVLLRGLCDFTLSGQASALEIAQVLASLIDAVENVKVDKPTQH